MLEFIRKNLFLFIILFLCLCAPQFVFGAFKFIALLAIGVLFVAIIGTLVFRWRIASIVEEMNKRAGGAQGGSHGANGSDNKSETIGTNKSREVPKDVGDYVDFEDINE